MNQVESTLSRQLTQPNSNCERLEQAPCDCRCSCSNSCDLFGFISLDELRQQLTSVSTEHIKPAFTELGHTESPRIEIHFNAPVTINISNA